MYLELYIYFNKNDIILFTLDDPDKDFFLQALDTSNIILYKTRCDEDYIYTVADEIIHTFNTYKVNNSDKYNFINYHQMITLHCNNNIYEIMNRFNKSD